jgi:hypothetical protein
MRTLLLEGRFLIKNKRSTANQCSFGSKPSNKESFNAILNLEITAGISKKNSRKNYGNIATTNKQQRTKFNP